MSLAVYVVLKGIQPISPMATQSCCLTPAPVVVDVPVDVVQYKRMQTRCEIGLSLDIFPILL